MRIIVNLSFPETKGSKIGLAGCHIANIIHWKGNDTFHKNKKISMSVLGLNSKDRKSTRDKANISNPKVNRGCAPLTANRTSADCGQISLGPSIPYIPLGVYHAGGFNAMWSVNKFIYFQRRMKSILSHDEHANASHIWSYELLYFPFGRLYSGNVV